MYDGSLNKGRGDYVVPKEEFKTKGVKDGTSLGCFTSCF